MILCVMNVSQYDLKTETSDMSGKYKTFTVIVVKLFQLIVCCYIPLLQHSHLITVFIENRAAGIKCGN